MFVSDMEQKLRQGDILHGVWRTEMAGTGLVAEMLPPFARAQNERKLQVSSPAMAVVPVKEYWVAVMSQCCELEMRKNCQGKAVPPHHVIVAPLSPVPDNESARADLARHDLDSYFELFWVEARAPLPGEFCVNFALAFSLKTSGQAYERILAAKVLQMNDPVRVRFKEKLGLYFARPTQEELDSGLWTHELTG